MRMVEAVDVHRNRSGGVVKLHDAGTIGELKHCHEWRKVGEQYIRLAADHLDDRLRLLQDRERATFLGVADSLRDRMILKALNHGQITEIGLDTFKRFFHNIALVNQSTYDRY